MTTDLHLEVAARLRRAGQRYSSRRRALVEIVAAAGKPRSIPEILQGRRGLAQSSVYRNLAVLEQAGVVRRIVTGEDFARFELAEDLSEHHHHLVCSSCGAVEDVALPPTLERRMEGTLTEVAASAGFIPAAHRLDVIGTCRECG
ncbi:MAG TPA: Fur family transcriptional regulator [Actinomycetota bacterium]